MTGHCRRLGQDGSADRADQSLGERPQPLGVIGVERVWLVVAAELPVWVVVAAEWLIGV